MVWPLARSNAGRISSVAALMAVETKALISAACAGPLKCIAKATVAATAIRRIMSSRPSIGFEAFGSDHGLCGGRGEVFDQRFGARRVLRGRGKAGREYRLVLDVRRQRADDVDAGH